jgi:uncharacterized protein YbaR (Trm112 family)
MFEAFVLVCMLKTPLFVKHYKTHKDHTKLKSQCVKRAYEIAMELPEYMPEYVAVKYKCDAKGQDI